MRRTMLLFVAVAFSITACSSNSTRPALSKNTQTPFAPAWLGDRVPEDALAYLRIPSIFGLTSGPKDNGLGALLGSDAHNVWINRVLNGLSDNVATRPGFEAQAIQWLLRHQRSPIELMVSPVPGAGGTAPGIVMVMQADMTSNAQVNQALSSLLAETIPGVGIPAGFDEDGIGVITGAPVPAVVGFEADSQRIMILAGAGATVERMAVARQALSDIPTDTPMRKMQMRIDESGYGLFGWVNTRNALAMGQMMIPPQYMEPVIASGLDQAESVAFGYGVSRGKTRMSFLADVPKGNGLRSLIPAPNNSLALKTTDAPDYLFVMSLPTLEEAKAIAMATGKVDADQIQEFVRLLSDEAGTDVEALYEQVAGEILYVKEPVGGYSAFALGDAAQLDTIMSEIAEKFDLTFQTRRIRGLDIRHFKIPGAPSDELNEAASGSSVEPALASFLSIYANIGTHVFWTYEDGYAIFAYSPQVLIDRHERGAKRVVRDWADNTQNQDLSETVLGASISVEGLPRFAHQAYVATMPILSDIAGLEMDIWSLPTADDLNLPDRGAISFSMITASDLLGAEFAFEHSPADIIGGAGGALTGVFVTGIVAAIAIPAYQDYTKRAEVAAALIGAGTTKLQIAQFVAANNRFPNQLESASIQNGAGFEAVLGTTISVQPGTGTIVIRLDDSSAALRGASLMLEPELNDGVVIGWTCSSDAEERYLPYACRDGEVPDSREVNKVGP